MIEAHVDVKTTDGYLLHLFCVGFTKKRNNQIQKTSYAQHQQVHQIRKKMMEIMTQEVQTSDLKEVVNKLIPDSTGKDIEKTCQSIYLLHGVFVRKVKMLNKPQFELGKLMEQHGEGSSAGTSLVAHSGKATGDEAGAKVEVDGYLPVQESV
ncbi:LOW QUALITY PROTEIN: small ribosomal subunit protein eS1-like [Megaptera novaeangliae]